MHMIAHRPRDADAARRAFGLEPGRHIHRVAMQVGSVGNRVADIDPDAKADGPIGRVVIIMVRNLLLHLHGAAHCSVDAVEHDQQRVAAGLNDPAAMLRDRRVDHIAPQSAQPFESSDVVKPDQAAVADHVGIDHGYQPTVRLATPRSMPKSWSETSSTTLDWGNASTNTSSTRFACETRPLIREPCPPGQRNLHSAGLQAEKRSELEKGFAPHAPDRRHSRLRQAGERPASPRHAGTLCRRGAGWRGCGPDHDPAHGRGLARGARSSRRPAAARAARATSIPRTTTAATASRPIAMTWSATRQPCG